MIVVCLTLHLHSVLSLSLCLSHTHIHINILINMCVHSHTRTRTRTRTHNSTNIFWKVEMFQNMNLTFDFIVFWGKMSVTFFLCYASLRWSMQWWFGLSCLRKFSVPLCPAKILQMCQWLCPLWLPVNLSVLSYRLVSLVVKASASRVEDAGFKSSEPGIHHGNKDSHRNENWKSWEKNFSAKKQIDKYTFFFFFFFYSPSV